MFQIPTTKYKASLIRIKKVITDLLEIGYSWDEIEQFWKDVIEEVRKK